MGLFGLAACAAVKDINEEKTFITEEINNIQINLNTETLRILRTEESNEAKLHLYGKATKEIKLASELNDKTMTVSLKQAKGGLNVFLDVYIPKNYDENISAKLSSGAIKVHSVDLAKFAVNTSSGKTEVENLNAGKININTFTGEVIIKKVSAREVEIKGKSSAIYFEECVVNNAKAHNSSGKITLTNNSGNFDLKGKSGKVMASYNDFENQNLNVQTDTGGIIMELPGTAEFFISAKTNTGKIKSDFSINPGGYMDKKMIEGQIGDENNKVSLKSWSGSIKIIKK